VGDEAEIPVGRPLVAADGQDAAGGQLARDPRKRFGPDRIVEMGRQVVSQGDDGEFRFRRGGRDMVMDPPSGE